MQIQECSEAVDMPRRYRAGVQFPGSPSQLQHRLLCLMRPAFMRVGIGDACGLLWSKVSDQKPAIKSKRSQTY